MKLLNRLKHWQVFILIVLLPMIILITQLSEITGYLNTHNHPKFLGVLNSVSILPGTIALSGALFFLWVLSIGHATYSSSNLNNSKSIKLFYVTCLFNIFFLLGVASYVTYTIQSKELDILNLSIILILSFIYALSVIYCLHFASKRISKHNGKSKFNYILAFLLLLFYPIGIWLIQPLVSSERKTK